MNLCAGCGAVIVPDIESAGLCAECAAGLAAGRCSWSAAEKKDRAVVADRKEVA